MLSTSNFVRLDLTEGKEFTISDATKEVLGEVPPYLARRLPRFFRWMGLTPASRK